MSTQPPVNHDEPAAAPASNGWRKLALRLLVAVIVLAAIAWTLWYFLDGRWYEATEDAYVQGNVVQITPQVAGTVVSFSADDGDLVKAGQVLVKLDPSDGKVAVAQATANLARAVRQVRGLFSSANSSQAMVAARKVSLDKARADYDRRRDLAKSGAISAEELAHARDALAAAQSALIGASQQQQTSQALVDDTVVASHPDVMAAAAALRAAYLDEERTTLRSPVTGYVAMRSVQLGQRVQPGTPLMAVVPLHEVWVDANFKETQLLHMRIGQPVSLESDVYGSDVKFQGRIQSLGIGTGSAFALLPAQNATGNWIKIVQRVGVRVVLDPQQLQKYPLRIGFSMKARVSLRDGSGPMLAQQPPTEPLFTTDIYASQLAAADALVKRVIHQNMPATAATPTSDQKTD